MVSPVYAVENWLGKMLHVSHEAPVLGLIFIFFLIRGAGAAIAGCRLAGHAAWGGVRRACCRWWFATPTGWFRWDSECGSRTTDFTF